MVLCHGGHVEVEGPVRGTGRGQVRQGGRCVARVKSLVLGGQAVLYTAYCNVYAVSFLKNYIKVQGFYTG